MATEWLTQEQLVSHSRRSGKVTALRLLLVQW